ncbi:MAG: hypothetical protein AUJ32_00850 [Parcubacteria group bacterium CG1_02_40_82]|uniref:Uncharacterized protein n=4 Tax=Candidatus Portnoyibacteriota TaxID=1817913 RepID=A0A2M7IH78_9BACT|nr:MAG: hypothetical protein AUJ32_00850 [Parcubacteria group bacterium CG1_02_40_82]PIQ75116.1 MAG: hypothetical protein COV84_02885 [Candidatus Portnoybacteria bacterium CG11_big_fil_rev_8_21_14_0_20_40_15]PIS31550.1 MAG: hypothetical protein COT41_01355 [Candidatus Portnoybacteria bacterium CG08_land_8_20_14_0_20_40_83]PIW75849.1 MAG: hypothetical protein CO001_04455 [Candidatus Portnoybacteria bacterium CG_4_8_14_3_um_filter_40_10]PIY74902.1 MAG: hypothetical protein COY85_01810 [Candidatus
MANFLLFISSVIKKIFKFFFWLIALVLFAIFILWAVGKFHPIFDIGIDNYVIKIINLIRAYLGLK